ncbi:DUF6090 family protein [Flagellimonas allohymeniacidonis]|uniref:Uncharacterized protein n=1 Tax=Flagellimonas allohymeniacidonis TaxID=2517819 RepID=A0A4Q8QGY5_9FLAO|nr:DUF6090 family protein [Allomuricauda hymeniacidonis]TAI48508.1 hypothetical protein EW142_01505 [Allomuricauda hymeniacidonis]
MSKVFRKIRQTLLKENRFSKYLLYAIGEIVLVVIGILIALQINNWSEARKRNIEEEELLVALIEDFEENKNRIDEAISREKDMIKMSRSLIGAMQSDQKTMNTDSIRFWVASGAKSWWKAGFVTGTYDAMVSSGKIEILENDNLKRILSQFAADINLGFEDHEESMSYLVEMNKISADVAPALIHDIQRKELGVIVNSKDLDAPIKKLMGNDAYLGFLISKTWLETLRVGYQEKLRAYIDEIIAICQSELKK